MTNLEQDILQAAQQATSAAIRETLTKYDSPLFKLVKQVVEENNTELKALISDSFQKVIRTEEFKTSILSAFSNKVAHKVSNDLKQDAIFKAKMAMAVSNVVEECLQERENKA